MRRGHRQRTTGAEKDWTQKSWRHAFGLHKKSGRGKYSKRQMARRRRREPFETDDFDPVTSLASDARDNDGAPR